MKDVGQIILSALSCPCSFVRSSWLRFCPSVSGLRSFPAVGPSFTNTTLSLLLSLYVWVLQLCLFFFFKIVLPVLVPFSFHINFRIGLLIYTENCGEILIGIALNLQIDPRTDVFPWLLFLKETVFLACHSPCFYSASQFFFILIPNIYFLVYYLIFPLGDKLLEAGTVFALLTYF